MPDIHDVICAVAALEAGWTVVRGTHNGRQFYFAISPDIDRNSMDKSPLTALAGARAAGLNPADYPVAGALLRLVETALRLDTVLRRRLRVLMSALDDEDLPAVHEFRRALVAVKGEMNVAPPSASGQGE